MEAELGKEGAFLYVRSRRTFAVCVILFAVVMAAHGAAALLKPNVAFDDPLWFMRARVLPTDLSTDDHRFWAIDVPALNRWCYWAALKVTGLDRIPANEPPAWSINDGRVYFNGVLCKSVWVPVNPAKRDMELFEARHGAYAPRAAIVALRFVNLAAFGVLITCLWLTARMVLGSDILAFVTILPICLLRTWVASISTSLLSGDIFMLAGMALALLIWTRFHLAGSGASWASVALTGAAAGLATSGKHPGVTVVAAFMIYLAWQTRGWGRIVKPAAAAAIAFAVFVAVNPAVIAYPGAAPWEVLKMMMTRREDVAAGVLARAGSKGRAEMWWLGFFWLPMVPPAIAGFWVLRRERWVPPVAICGASIVLLTAAGLLRMGVEVRFLAPIEMALYFPACLAAMALIVKFGRAREEAAQGKS